MGKSGEYKIMKQTDKNKFQILCVTMNQIDFSKIKSKKEVGKCFDYAILPKQTTSRLSVTAVKKQLSIIVRHFVFHLLIGLQL